MKIHPVEVELYRVDKQMGRYDKADGHFSQF
jgi:hypothetical protein